MASLMSHKGCASAVALFAIVVTGCNVTPAPIGEGETDQLSADAVADFALEDVNPESPRYGELVSPRDYIGQVSAWYFGHST